MASAADVSVVIVTLGDCPLLSRSVQAIAAGSVLPRQVIVVDQGGPGLGPGLERDLAGSGIELVHLSVPRIGVSRARNTAARTASSALLAFTDDDCVPHPDWLSALTAAVASSTADASSGRVLPLDEGMPGRVAVSSRTETAARVFAGEQVPWRVGTGGNLLVRHDQFMAMGGFDEEFGPGAALRAAEDIELLDRLLGTGVAVAYTPGAIVYHQMQTRAGRLRRRFPYGFGMGSFIAQTPRRRRRALAGTWASMQGRSLASALRHGSIRGAVESLVMVCGFSTGYATMVRTRRGRTTPPPLQSD